MTKTALSINLSSKVRVPGLRGYQQTLANVAVHIRSKIPKGVSELSVLFTNDSEIRKLNRRYRQKDKATDVLSFPQCCDRRFDKRLSGKVQDFSLGDIVISVPTARRQAKLLGQPLKTTMQRLLIHGFLHLLGYDHENVSVKKAKQMHDLEKLLLRLCC